MEEKWYGRTTFSIGERMRQQRRCGLVHDLQGFRSYRKKYFNDDSDSWWREIPVSVTGVPSGIYSDDTYNEAQQKLSDLKDGAGPLSDIGIPLEVDVNRVELLRLRRLSSPAKRFTGCVPESIGLSGTTSLEMSLLNS